MLLLYGILLSAVDTWSFEKSVGKFKKGHTEITLMQTESSLQTLHDHLYIWSWYFDRGKTDHTKYLYSSCMTLSDPQRPKLSFCIVFSSYGVWTYAERALCC